MSAAENTAQAVKDQAAHASTEAHHAGQSLYEQATALAQDALNYGSQAIHLTRQKAGEGAGAASQAQVPGQNKTLGELVHDGQKLATNALHAAHDYVQPKEGATVHEGTLTDKARAAVASAIDYVVPAQGSQAKVEQVTQDASKAAEQKVAEGEKVAADLKNRASAVASDVGTKASQSA